MEIINSNFYHELYCSLLDKKEENIFETDDDSKDWVDLFGFSEKC